MRFRFSGFEIDMAQNELRCGDKFVHLEPQVFDLLALLIRHRERVVSKDDIIAAIWGGRIVSESALSSRINAVRRALGDTGSEQAFIKTISKRGFRFVGDIEPLDADSHFSSDTAVGAGCEDSAAVRLLAAVPSIAVLPFKIMGVEGECGHFSDGLVEDIVRLIARSRWLTVISSHAATSFAKSGCDLRKAGEFLGVRYVVAGSVRRTTDHARIHVELVSVLDGSQLWSDLYELMIDDLFSVQEEMARQIAATIEPELCRIEQGLSLLKDPQRFDALELLPARHGRNVVLYTSGL